MVGVHLRWWTGGAYEVGSCGRDVDGFCRRILVFALAVCSAVGRVSVSLASLHFPRFAASELGAPPGVSATDTLMPGFRVLWAVSLTARPSPSLSACTLLVGPQVSHAPLACVRRRKVAA